MIDSLMPNLSVSPFSSRRRHVIIDDNDRVVKIPSFDESVFTEHLYFFQKAKCPGGGKFVDIFLFE